MSARMKKAVEKAQHMKLIVFNQGAVDIGHEPWYTHVKDIICSSTHNSRTPEQALGAALLLCGGRSWKSLKPTRPRHWRSKKQ